MHGRPASYGDYADDRVGSAAGPLSGKFTGDEFFAPSVDDFLDASVAQ
jgi:hypothetical protein